MQPDEVARLCLERYSALGTCSAKPHVRADGKHEWTVLAGVVLSVRERVSPARNEHRGEAIQADTETSASHALCIALGTGVKALPYTALSVHGDVLHDCHAEVLARRSARHWLLSRLVREAAFDSPTQTKAEAATVDGLPFIFVRRCEHAHHRPWRLRDGVGLHLYCSTMPCGDASSRLTMQQQAQRQTLDFDMSWGKQPQLAAVLRGRAHSSMSSLHLRTKPGRTQAEASLSMSCTDKIASWCILGFQGALLYRWVGRLSFDSIVIGSDALRCSDTSMGLSEGPDLNALSAVEHCRNVISKKCSNITLDADAMHMPDIALSSRLFADGREEVQRRRQLQSVTACSEGPPEEQGIVPCAASLTWTHGSKQQGVIDGRRQGASAHRAIGQALKRTSRSYLSKLDWFQAVMGASASFQKIRAAPEAGAMGDASSRYNEAKRDFMAEEYQTLKQVLRGTRHMADSQRQSLEHEQVAAFLQGASTTRAREVRSPTSTPLPGGTSDENAVDDAAPFRGWLVTGVQWAYFMQDGLVKQEAR